MASDTDRVAEVFRDKTIFITGGTGFIGKALIEKLLRVSDPKKIYVLIRQRKGKTPQERLQEIFKNVVFTVLLEKKPDAIKKCQCISGDVTEIDLGIGEKDRKVLQKEIDIIFHCAATTRFDDTLKYSVTMNTRGTKFVLDLAEQCQHLNLMVHVSTAYAFPKEEVTYERPYDPPANPHEVLNSLNWVGDDAVNDIARKLIGDIPNTYTFSKALAEALVIEKMDKLPIIINRPAVVIPSFRDPFPGWFNNLQGPMGLFVGSGKGVIRSMYMDSRSYANLIPIDATVDIMLVSSWNYLKQNGKDQRILNVCVPLNDFKFTWEEIIARGKKVINEKVPFNGILWYPDGIMTKNRIYNKINFYLFQLIPALFIDLLLFILGYKPILFNIQMRILKGADMFEFYTDKAWDFETTAIENIRKKLNKKELQVYVLKAENFNIDDYLVNSILSCRRHILKETDDMLPAARRNMKIMYALDKIVKTLFFIAIGYYLYSWLQPSGIRPTRMN